MAPTCANILHVRIQPNAKKRIKHFDTFGEHFEGNEFRFRGGSNGLSRYLLHWTGSLQGTQLRVELNDYRIHWHDCHCSYHCFGIVLGGGSRKFVLQTAVKPVHIDNVLSSSKAFRPLDHLAQRYIIMFV